MIARLQFWLQGFPNKRRPWAVAWIGNRISDGRYWLWRLRGGKWPESKLGGPFVTIDVRYPTATSTIEQAAEPGEDTQATRGTGS